MYYDRFDPVNDVVDIYGLHRVAVLRRREGRKRETSQSRPLDGEAFKLINSPYEPFLGNLKDENIAG